MTHRRRHFQPKFNQGFSLIELMVSLTIGLIIMVSIISAYLGSSKAGRVAEAQGRMNEDANAALTILTQQLRMAGNNPKQPNYMDAPPVNPVFSASSFTVRGCEGPFGNVTNPIDLTTLTCTSTTSTLPDSIAVSYEGDTYSTFKTTGVTPRATDCDGNPLPIVAGSANVWNGVSSAPQAVTYTVANNLFYIGTSTAITSPSLYCKGNGGTVGQPLVENIEDMQLVYGTSSTTTTTLAVAGYLTAGGIASDPNLSALPDDATRWGKVMTVRICILVRSDSPVLSGDPATFAQYVKCDGSVETSPPDARLRRAYFATVVLRNRLSF
jgi:type IV pilus assembly protein PilW